MIDRIPPGERHYPFCAKKISAAAWSVSRHPRPAKTKMLPFRVGLPAKTGTAPSIPVQLMLRRQE
jgi:hypothetical protein